MIAIAAAAAVGLLWFVNRPHPAATTAPLSADAKAYVRNLQLSEVTMKATESYVGQTVTEIEGKIANAAAAPSSMPMFIAFSTTRTAM